LSELGFYEVKSTALVTISVNTELRNTLKKMGYSPESAAEAFATASGQLKNQNPKLNLGTLAICGSMELSVPLLGREVSVCTTLFNSYAILASQIAIGGTVSMSGMSVYFKTHTPEAPRYYYTGGSGEFGLGITYAGSVLKEVRAGCDGYACQDQYYNDWDGYFAAIKIGAGASLIAGISEVQVIKLASYW